MLLNYPGLWGMRLPAVLFFGVVFNLLAAAIVWMWPLENFDDFPDIFWMTSGALIFGILLMIIWLVASARFDPLAYHGRISRIDVRLRPLVFLLVVAFLMGPAGTLFFQFNVRLGSLYQVDSAEFENDLLKVQNFESFLNGYEGYYHDAFLMATLGDTTAAHHRRLTYMDTVEVYKQMLELEAKYDGYSATPSKPIMVQQQQQQQQIPDIEFDDPEGLPKKRPEQQQVQSYQTPEQEQSLESRAEEYANARISPISMETQNRLYEYSRMVSLNVKEDWLSWLLNMAALGVFLAFVLATIDHSARFLGGWFALLTILNGFIVSTVLLFLGFMVSGIIVALFPEAFGRGELGTNLNFFDPDMLGGVMSMVFSIPLLLILEFRIFRKASHKSNKERFWVSVVPALWMSIGFSVVFALGMIFPSYNFENPELNSFVLFACCTLIYLVGVPFMKKRFYKVYILPGK